MNPSGDLPGKLIAVEGLDGSGKSTQLYLLKRWLELRGLKVYFTEWNSSLIVKKATSKGKKRQLLTPTTFSLIHCTDFADRYERQILPLLKAGYLVLCDRYFYTAFARDAVRGCNRAWLHNLYGYARQPDLTLFFDTPLAISRGRILGIVPNQDVFWKGNLQVIERLLQSIGVRTNTVFTEFAGLEALKRIPAAELNLVFSPWVGVRTAKKLEEKFGTPFEVINSIPIGPKETTRFLQRIGNRLKLSKKTIARVAEDEERRAYRFAEYFSEAFVISVPHAYFGIVADSATAIGLLKYGANELGWNPELVILTDNPPDEYREAITRELVESPEGVVRPKVIFEVDSHRIRQILQQHTLQVILASSLEKYIAHEELDAIHLSVAFPIYDKVVIDRSYAGYRGGLAFIEDLTATYAGPL